MRRSVAVGVFLAAIVLRGDEVDNFVQAQLASQKIPGLSLAVIRNGEVIKSRGYGLADLEHQVPATEDTVYLLASVTKQFTATAVMMLVQDGKIKLDEPIGRYLENTPEAWNGITIRHLLTHTGGLSRIIPYQRDPGWMTSPHSLAEILKLSTAEPVLFPPGDKFSYSNTGYCLLGYVIEKVSGKSYWDFLHERIFQPLGMNATRNSDPTAIIPDRAGAYSVRRDGWINQPHPHPSVGFSAGCLMSTVRDMAKWDAALWGDKLLRQTVLQEMWTPAHVAKGESTYGFGWNIRETGGHRFVGHNGEFVGTSTQIMRFLDDKLTIILLINRDQVNTAPMAMQIYSILGL